MKHMFVLTVIHRCFFWSFMNVEGTAKTQKIRGEKSLGGRLLTTGLNMEIFEGVFCFSIHWRAG